LFEENTVNENNDAQQVETRKPAAMADPVTKKKW